MSTTAPAFRDLLHHARVYLRMTGDTLPTPRQIRKRAATWEIVSELRAAGYDYPRIAAHLQALDRLRDLATTRKADRTRAAAFMAELIPALERRARTHHAYVTAGEAAILQRYNLRQPGHTRYRYSTPSEDLSDAAQLEEEA